MSTAGGTSQISISTSPDRTGTGNWATIDGSQSTSPKHEPDGSSSYPQNFVQILDFRLGLEEQDQVDEVAEGVEHADLAGAE